MKIYTSPYPMPSIPTNLSITQYLTAINPDSVSGHKVILEDDWSGKSLTYASFRARASEEEYAWKMRDLEEGGVVGICGVNCVDYVAAVHGVLWAGGVVALFSAMSTVSDFVHAFNIIKPRFIIVDPDVIEKVSTALGQVKEGEKTRIIIHLGNTDNHPQLNQLIRYPRDFSINVSLTIPTLLGKDARKVTALILFSSGTSSLPKAVCISHYALIASLACMRASDPQLYSSTSSSVFFAPLSHIYGLNAAVFMTPWLGAYMILMRSYELGKFLRLCEEKNVSTLRIVPSIAIQMVKEGALDGYNLGSVRFVLCSGAKLEDSVVERLHEKLGGAPISQGYWMTESNVATLRCCEAGKVGSVGRLFAGVEARLVDDDMNDVGPGQAGELLVRGPTVFSGYLNDPQATKEAFYNGWLKTGDILHIDSEGYLYLIERKKEIIKYKSLQISPTQLEALLATHPFVLEAVVCAKWDKEQGTEVPIAYIVLNPSGFPSMNKAVKNMVFRDVRKWFDERVAEYKRLRGGVEVTDIIPKTAVGEMVRWKLPARLEMEREREREEGKMGAKL